MPPAKRAAPTAAAAAPPAKQQARAKPVSVRAADEADLRSSEALATTLVERGGVHVAELAAERAAVCAALEVCLAEWVKSVALAHGLSSEQVDEADCRVFQLGSCALNVPLPGADVDCVAIVPYFVERRHVFAPDGLIAALLQLDGLDTHSLHPVPAAFVPVIKMVVHNIPVDLLVARLKVPQIARDLVPEAPGLLHRCIDAVDANSLNGARVASAILRRVPHTDRFRATLRAVKLWARRRGIDQQSSGFPGGVAWALLTARVCQMHPNAAPATLLAKFFNTWQAWRYGDDPKGALPILLDHPTATATATAAATATTTAAAATATTAAAFSSALSSASAGATTSASGSSSAALGAWEDELPAPLAALDWRHYPGDKKYLMPVITPCKPRMCTTHTTSHATLAVLKHEIHRANELCKGLIIRAPPTVGDDRRWEPLFEPTDFFTQYERYVVVQLTCDRDDELRHWNSFIKARLHKLVGLLEKVGDVGWVQPLPWPLRTPPAISDAVVDDLQTNVWRPRCCFFVGVRFASKSAAERTGGTAKRLVDLRPVGNAFVALGEAWVDRAALCPTAKMLVQCTRRKDLPDALLHGAHALPFFDEHDACAIRGALDATTADLTTATGDDGNHEGDATGAATASSSPWSPSAADDTSGDLRLRTPPPEEDYLRLPL